MTHTIVLTRPHDDSLALAQQMQAQGIFCLIEPMLRIEHSKESLRALKAALQTPLQAIIITSRHALALLAECNAFFIPVIAVGKSSADAAQKLGFQHVSYADGNVESLAAYILQHCSPDKGALLYVHGEDIYYDLATQLRANGFQVETHTVYSAIALDNFAPALVSALRAETIDAVVFYSARTAQIYEKIATKLGLQEYHGHAIAVCLSQNIADVLCLLPWQHVYVDISNLPRYLAEKDDTTKNP